MIRHAGTQGPALRKGRFVKVSGCCTPLARVSAVLFASWTGSALTRKDNDHRDASWLSVSAPCPFQTWERKEQMQTSSSSKGGLFSKT